MAYETVLLQQLLREIADRTASEQDAYAIRLAADTLDELCLSAEIVRLRLTEAEREALEMFSATAWTAFSWSVVLRHAASLRGLLERTK